MINWWKTELGDAESLAAAQAIKDKHLSSGPVVAEFENKFANLLNVKHAVACPSGTMALVMSMIAHDIEAGDEVIVPCNTWIATAHAAMLVGAKVRLVDVLSDRTIIDYEKIEEKITPNTKAIIPVHLNGRAANIKEINNIASKYNIAVIEDACQAMLSKNEHGFLGTQSFTGCFSLGVTKLITTGQGGMVVTNDREMYEKLLLVRNNGMESILTPRYERFGVNFKFSDILAAVGIAQLSIINDHVKSICELYEKYEDALENLYSINLIPMDYNNGELPLYVEVVTDQRAKLMEHLKKNNIHARVLPPALVEAPQLRQNGEYPNAKFFGRNGMCLPSGPDQSDEDIEKVINSLKIYENLVT